MFKIIEDVAELGEGDTVIAGYGYHCKVLAVDRGNQTVAVSYQPLSEFIDLVSAKRTSIILIEKNNAAVV